MNLLDLEKGFPLDTPNIILPWDKPLDEVARMSGGIWHKDRYVWEDAKYFDGLSYLLCSENGVGKQNPFKRISAYIGLYPEGVWSDQIALAEYKKVVQHLIRILGEPNERRASPEVPDAEELIWIFQKVKIYLAVIEQHVYKCYLTISSK
ncbi:MAG TPA: hypothetical protein VFR24_07795 [Candidatus Angelobacter sp.]|nr:hypothetical protein [Candidatus Angelobacter sp.]